MSCLWVILIAISSVDSADVARVIQLCRKEAQLTTKPRRRSAVKRLKEVRSLDFGLYMPND